jgi:hypothetical protein
MPWFERGTRQHGVPKATVKRHEDGSNIYAVEEKTVVGSVGDISPDTETTFVSRCTNCGQKEPYFT